MRNASVQEKICYAKINDSIYQVVIKGYSHRGNAKCLRTCINNDAIQIVKPTDLFETLNKEQMKEKERQEKIIKEKLAREKEEAEELLRKKKEETSKLGIPFTDDVDELLKLLVPVIKEPSFEDFYQVFWNAVKAVGVNESKEYIDELFEEDYIDFDDILMSINTQTDWRGYIQDSLLNNLPSRYEIMDILIEEKNPIFDLYNIEFECLDCDSPFEKYAYLAEEWMERIESSIEDAKNKLLSLAKTK